MKVILLVLLLCAATFPLAAQLNESDTLNFQLKTGISGNLQKGNVDLFLIRGRLEFSFIPVKTLVFKSQNSSLYQSFSGRKADNDLFSRNYLYFRPERRLYPFAISYSSSNFRRRIRFPISWIFRRPCVVYERSAKSRLTTWLALVAVRPHG